MESTKMEDNWVNNDQNFEAEQEKIDEKHRTEILNLLKSFEFEKKDMETRFHEELEKKESELKNLQQSIVEKEGLSSNDVLGLQEQFQREKNERQEEVDKEHSTDTGTGQDECILISIASLRKRGLKNVARSDNFDVHEVT